MAWFHYLFLRYAGLGKWLEMVAESKGGVNIMFQVCKPGIMIMSGDNTGEWNPVESK